MRTGTGTGKGKNSREFEAFSRCHRTPGQTPTATELASPHTAGPQTPQSLLNFCPCPSLPYCRPLFSDHRFTSAQIALLEQVRWSNAYPRSGAHLTTPRPTHNSVRAAFGDFLAANSTGTKRP